MSIFEELRPVLEKATRDERRALVEILDGELDDEELEELEGTEDDLLSPEKVAFRLQWRYQSIWGWMFREDENVSYSEIVVAVADKLDIEYPEVEYYEDVNVEDLEVRIAQHVLKKMWKEMTPTERKQMERDLQQTAQEFGQGRALIRGASGASVFAALTAAKLSGFSVYLLASTSLKFLTAPLGITLPFAAYTATSTTIWWLLGPPGWVIAGALTILGISGGNYQRVIPAVVYIAALRAKPQRRANWERRLSDF